MRAGALYRLGVLAGGMVTLAQSGPACDRKLNQSALAPESGATAATRDAASGAPAEGIGDYRGTIGATTSVAVHVVREGPRVSGSYAYTAIGRPIALEGRVDPSGRMMIVEVAGGHVTGTMQLHPEGADLVGEWSDPSGKKSSPVRLSVGTSFDGAQRDAQATPPLSAVERAEDCLINPLCSATEAARLFVAASDAEDSTLDCFRFVDGAGAARDLERARACLERSEKAMHCAGSSPDFEAVELAMMRIDGVGGKADVAAARALLADCFRDVSTTAVLEHADAKEHDPRTPAVDFCKDIGGTTFTMNQCAIRENANADTETEVEGKVIVTDLDDDGVKSFIASEKAYTDYVAAMGAFVYEVYVEGTIRDLMSLNEQSLLKAARAAEVAAFPKFVATDTSTAEVERAQRNSAAAMSKVTTETRAEKEKLQQTQRAWIAYRDADVALYQHVFGPKQGRDRVRSALLVRLESRRAKECAPPSLAP